MPRQDIRIDGKHLVVLGINGTAGDRHGIVQIRVPVVVPDLETAFTLSPAAVAAAVGITNVTCVDRPFADNESGEIQVDFDFEGAYVENETSHEFDGEMGEYDMQEHPAFLELKEEFGWDEENKCFPDTAPKQASNSGTGFSQGNEELEASEVAGQKAWLSATGTYEFTYAVRTISPEIYSSVGRVTEYPPQGERIGLPHYPDRNWLELAPRVADRGGAKLVTRRYKLSDPGGFSRRVYSFSQL